MGKQISVCLLTYNHAHLIESTLASVRNQTLSGYEIIVSDDCSSDETWSILQKASALDSRIRPIRTPQNLGMSGNANYAISQCSRPYIALLHHDDIYRQDLLEKWLLVMLRHPNMGFVFNAYLSDQNGFIYKENINEEVISGKKFLERHLFARWGCAVRGTAMIRRALWDIAGGMRDQFELLSDVDLWMRLCMIGSVGYVSEPLIAIRQVRPVNYPDAYKHEGISWHRKRLLYEIHACNRLSYYNLSTIDGWIKWMKFRFRLSLETSKWLSYSVIRQNSEMIRSIEDSATEYDLWFLQLYRRLLVKVFN